MIKGEIDMWIYILLIMVWMWVVEGDDIYCGCVINEGLIDLKEMIWVCDVLFMEIYLFFEV